MTSIPLLSPVLPDQPDVWKELTAAQIAAANEKDEYGNLTREAMVVRQEAVNQRWYLVRNVFNWKSGRTGRIERYFTTTGIERPYQGLYGIYAAYNDIVQNSELTQDITMEAHQIGAHEPISIEKAQSLYDRIVARTGPHRTQMDRIRRLGPRPGTAEREA